MNRYKTWFPTTKPINNNTASMMKTIRMIAATFVGCLAIQAHAASTMSTAAIASLGYIYGFPIVLMGETREGFTGKQRSCTLGTDINTLINVKDVPGTDFKAVVRPNVDTLYTSGMLDLSKGPQLLDIPVVSDHYILFALLDAWTNNFAGFGTQTHKDEEIDKKGHYAIVGPDWMGDVPSGYEKIPSTTNLVWIIGRTEVKGKDDIPAVNAIQDQYSLTSVFPQDSGIDPSEIQCVKDDERETPSDVVKSLSGEEFFTRLSALMIENPPPAEDAWMVSLLGNIGVGPEAKQPVQQLHAINKKALDKGIALAQGSLDTGISLLGIGGWGPNPKNTPLGEYERRYFIRALVAQVGFGANKRDFAVYQNAKRDADNEILNGRNDYTITFAANALPPVQAFWSVTVYGDDGYLTENKISKRLGVDRYALGSNDELVKDRKGNVTIYVSHLPPRGVSLSNWLPTPRGNFQMTARFYAPEEAILENEWKMPDIVKRD
ncbi:MAG: DUF1254 domain-containing protein [Oleibacter sp.]|nr:DUF1254 domain-containing protein [Thalassolituus sp.]